MAQETPANSEPQIISTSQSETRCPDCQGTYFHIFSDGSKECTHCKALIPAKQASES